MRTLTSGLVLVVAGLAAVVGLLHCSDPASATPDAGVDATTDVGTDAPTADSGTDSGFVDAGLGCSDQNPCSVGTCCSGACVDLGKDPKNCGACGAACSTIQFCNGKACVDAVMKNLCENPKVAIALDGLLADEQGGAAIGAAMDGGCTPSVAVRQVLQATPGVLDDAGRPLLGVGETYLATGGPFGQKAVAYMQSTKVGPITTLGDQTSFSFVRSSDSALLKKVDNVDLTAKHDWFIAYLAPEPQSGTLVFAVYGVLEPGTTAAVWWAQNVLVPNRATFTKQYYLVEWTDADDAGTPNAPDTNDTFTIAASGP